MESALTPEKINVEGRAAGACGRRKTSCVMHGQLSTDLVDALWDNYNNIFLFVRSPANHVKAIEIVQTTHPTRVKWLKRALVNKTYPWNKLLQTGHPKR